MSKATVATLYLAILLTIFRPTIERVQDIIIPGVEQLTVTLQEAAR